MITRPKSLLSLDPGKKTVALGPGFREPHSGTPPAVPHPTRQRDHKYLWGIPNMPIWSQQPPLIHL